MPERHCRIQACSLMAIEGTSLCVYHTCSVTGCNEKTKARNLCENHYRQARRRGEFPINLSGSLNKQILEDLRVSPGSTASQIALRLKRDYVLINMRLTIMFNKGFLEKSSLYATRRQPHTWSLRE